MYHMLAYAFVGFTALMVMGLLVLWWLESRDVARRKKVILQEIAAIPLVNGAASVTPIETTMPR